MKTGARLQAAIEVMDDVLGRHRPAAQALTDWGKGHRFAGSGDRAAIGNLVYDALRRKNSLAAQMGGMGPRELILAAASHALKMPAEAVDAAADGSPHAPAPLSEAERAALRRQLPADVPAHIAGDFPEWMGESFARAFGARAVEEGRALGRRAPLDLRANTLKADRDKVLKALSRFGARPTPLSPVGVRIAPAEGSERLPNVEAEPAHAKGWFEIQDEGSQLAALMAGVAPRRQVLDLCAGAGGKTLALAAAMGNTGQLFAYDADRLQLRPIFERLKRAGVRNVQVLPAGDEAALAASASRFDAVVVDAPCTGTGTWRRRPDAKWRLKRRNIAERQKEQQALLLLARRMLKPGGQLAYITCSLLPEENTDQVAWLIEQAPELALVPYAESWRAHLPSEPPPSADGRSDTLLLTPASHGTDGFFIAVLRRGS
ncbi:MAG: RsmB/NOP family class I SAM-dependent RNA methyltransferase [Hyphomicrobiaceae bacterium]